MLLDSNLNLKKRLDRRLAVMRVVNHVGKKLAKLINDKVNLLGRRIGYQTIGIGLLVILVLIFALTTILDYRSTPNANSTLSNPVKSSNDTNQDSLKTASALTINPVSTTKVTPNPTVSVNKSSSPTPCSSCNNSASVNQTSSSTTNTASQTVVSPTPTVKSQPTNTPIPYATGIPNPTATPTIPSSPSIPTQNFDFYLNPVGDCLPNGRGNGSGIVTKNSNGYWDFVINVNLLSLKPNRNYQLWLCHQSGNCSSHTSARTTTDSNGNSSFGTDIGGVAQINDPLKKVVVRDNDNYEATCLETNFSF